MGKLSTMQQRIYDYIASCIQEQGYPPSVREIGEAVGLKSSSTVHFHLKHLEEAGYIEKDAGKGRAITLKAPHVRENQVPIVGDVAAGSPILAQECIEDYLTFDTGGAGDEYFALRVRGESMLNAGILPGDLVVVRRQQTANLCPDSGQGGGGSAPVLRLLPERSAGPRRSRGPAYFAAGGAGLSSPTRSFSRARFSMRDTSRHI